jgi:hypothetical protein
MGKKSLEIIKDLKKVRFLFYKWANYVFLVTSIFTKLLLEYESHTAAHFCRFLLNINLFLRIFIQGSDSDSNCSKEVLIFLDLPDAGIRILFFLQWLSK